MSEEHSSTDYPDGRGALRGAFVVVAALVVLFEDTVWRALAALARQLAALPVWRQLEARIVRLPPYPAMTLFLLPVIVLFPIHALAVYLLAIGHVLSGIGLYVVIKVVGTVLLARLFTVLRPTLMTLDWFARLFTWWQGFKERLLARLRAHPIWARMTAFRRRARAWARRSRRWLAGAFGS